jgi:hypothetical protein
MANPKRIPHQEIYFKRKTAGKDKEPSATRTFSAEVSAALPASENDKKCHSAAIHESPLGLYPSPGPHMEQSPKNSLGFTRKFIGRRRRRRLKKCAQPRF